MGLEEQERIKRLVEENSGSDGIVVLLGSPDAESAEIFAETVTLGDPTWAGALAGVSLRLPVYHITEPEIRAAVDATVYAEQVEMMEIALDTAAIHEVMRTMRSRAEEAPA